MSASLAAAEAPVLRVCADPDNLPFTSSDSNERGLYLDLADAIAQRLNTRAEPMFFRTDAGRRALRATLLEQRCDVFFGLPVRETPDGPIALTSPFIELGYAVVLPRAASFRSLADLNGKSVGVQFASTAQTVLSTHDSVRMVTFRSIEDAITALAAREIDAAFLWGPMAGYQLARRGLSDAFRLVSVTGQNLRWKAAAGVRRDDQVLRHALDRELPALASTIAELARKYSFPLDPPVDLGAAVSEPTVAPTTPTTEGAESAHPGATPRPGKTNPFRGNPDVARLGRTLFNTHCSHCHSPNAQNPEPRTDLRRLHRRYPDTVDDIFYTTVTNGRPTKGMPPWGETLTEETIWTIKTFLETVQRTEE